MAVGAGNAAFVLFGLAAVAGATVGAVIGARLRGVLPFVFVWLGSGVISGLCVCVVTFCVGTAEVLLL
jgi:hypothetical protein